MQIAKEKLCILLLDPCFELRHIKKMQIAKGFFSFESNICDILLRHIKKMQIAKDIYNHMLPWLFEIKAHQKNADR